MNILQDKNYMPKSNKLHDKYQHYMPILTLYMSKITPYMSKFNKLHDKNEHYT